MHDFNVSLSSLSAVGAYKRSSDSKHNARRKIDVNLMVIWS